MNVVQVWEFSDLYACIASLYSHCKFASSYYACQYLVSFVEIFIIILCFVLFHCAFSEVCFVNSFTARTHSDIRDTLFFFRKFNMQLCRVA